MARRLTNTLQEFQEEFRDLLAQHYLGLPGRKPFRPAGSRDGVSLAVELLSQEENQLRVMEARNPLVYAANLSVSFRNEPRLSVSCFMFKTQYDQNSEILCMFF